MDGQNNMEYLANGNFDQILKSRTAQALLFDDEANKGFEGHAESWQRYLSDRIYSLLEEDTDEYRDNLFIVGCAALLSFLQSNVTGPPLHWSPARTTLPKALRHERGPSDETRRQLISSLAIDGIAFYPLTPNIELFSLAKILLNHQAVVDENNIEHLLFRVRVNRWRQRMLDEVATSLQQIIYSDLELLEKKILLEDAQTRAEFFVERATIHLDHGFDESARKDLAEATRIHGFTFALTGRLGKRTKFQETEISQLVVLAKSNDAKESKKHHGTEKANENAEKKVKYQDDFLPKPNVLNLDDDTLLESITFTETSSNLAEVENNEDLPESLRAMAAVDQPVLDPLDAVILLGTASSITNTSPQDGLTREETLPYATRVISDSSTNWQIYTQALLVRCRIEGYRSRTVERGLLQLQAIVDQVIAETTAPQNQSDTTERSHQDSENSTATNFFPRPKPSETASVAERLRYIHLLATPTRWKLESELADRWISLGGLKSALDIYERLEMWAEVALCWAAQDRDDKARKIIRQQLYIAPAVPEPLPEESLNEGVDGLDLERYTLERDPLPNDAPRLFCILGDLEKSVSAYDRAWKVSKQRYARAQRSLGKHYLASGDLHKANEAYAKSLRITPQNHGVWFALGCVKLQLEDWSGAVDSFARAIQIEEKDAESWSNLAAALLQLPPDTTVNETNKDAANGQSDIETTGIRDNSERGSQKHTREAFVALKRAANLKRDSYRIWQNLLQVAIQLSTPPYTDIVIAQNRLIELVGGTQGEKCVDIPVVEGLVNHLITNSTQPHVSQTGHHARIEDEPRSKGAGYEKMVIDLVQKKITPLITASRRLWLITAKLSIYLRRPSAALAAYEKAWRVSTNQPGWDSGTDEAKRLWIEVAEATSDLVDAYESLGERTRETGLAEGELVAKDWRFKARSAIRGIIGKAKEAWADSPEFAMLRSKLEALKTT